MKEEYLDAVSMVSAIGGTVGLCVGFSFTGLIGGLLKYLELAIKRIQDKSEQIGTQVVVAPNKNSDHILDEKLKRIEARLHKLELCNQKQISCEKNVSNQ